MIPGISIRVDGVLGLKQGLGSFQPHAVVSIGAPDERDLALPLFKDHMSRVCRLEFADISEPFRDYRPPNQTDLNDLFAFLRGIFTKAPQRDTPLRILVHCHAGLSRSPAIALAVLVFHDRLSGVEAASPARAEALFDQMLEAAPLALPHKLIVRMIDRNFPDYEGSFSDILARKAQKYQDGRLILPSNIF